jgi:hypothetical protein
MGQGIHDHDGYRKHGRKHFGYMYGHAMVAWEWPCPK